MLELQSNSLVFSFPEVHPSARLRISFKRTFRIPDDGRIYPLPPGFQNFPLLHVDDYKAHVPQHWLEHGGVMLPMHQSEAMWISFDCELDAERGVEYPFAIKIAAGKINAVTGQGWANELSADPQDYVVAPKQPWLDGFCVERGLIRQFVAMPLGSGVTVEEQLTSRAAHGGIQIIAYPMKCEAFERRFPKVQRRDLDDAVCCEMPCAYDMGLAAGGTMRQEVYADPYKFDEWDQQQLSRCFVHTANSQMWQAITGNKPPLPSLTAEEYTNAGLPWFDYYAADATPLDGSEALCKTKSLTSFYSGSTPNPLQEGEKVLPVTNVVNLEGTPVHDSDTW